MTPPKIRQYACVSNPPPGVVALPVEGQQVTQIQMDHRLGLMFDGGGLLAIGGVAVIERQDVEPERQVNVLAAIDLLWDRARRATADAGGSLTVEFESGRHLSVPTDPEYEPWEFVSRGGDVRVVSLPGGGVATWGLEA